MTQRCGRRRRRLVAAAVAGVLGVTAACSSGTDGGNGGSDGASEGQTSELDAYLAAIWGDVDDDPSAVDPDVTQEQELIAACMAEAGFEYHPDAGNRGGWSPAPAVLTTEFAREFGYGMTTEASGPGEPPLQWDVPWLTDPDYVWNSDYLMSLSPDAHEAYLLALNGPEAEDPDDIPPIQEQGCWGRAQAEVYGDTTMPAQFEAVNDEIQAMTRAIVVDPRVVAVQPRWASCMADAGYAGLAAVGDGEGLVNDLANQFGATTGDIPYDEIRAKYPDELAELQRTEVAVAVADTTCREEVGYDEIRDQVQTELEDRIVEMYRSDLEAWAAWAQEHWAADD